MKRILFPVLLAAWAIACGGEEKVAGSHTAQASAAPPLNGEKIYKEYCVICHGLYGDMGANGAANLSASQLTVEERVLVIANGRNTMAPFSSLLSEEKIQAVAAFTMKLTQQQ